MPDSSQQLSLWGDNTPQEPPPEDPTEDAAEPAEMGPDLDPQSRLSEALEAYLLWLRRTGSSRHTVKAFKSDIGLLATWLEEDKTIGSLGTSDLRSFLHWMRVERDKPCSPKTYARRVTALKNFFGYLKDVDAIKRDPSSAVVHRQIETPLPTVLSPTEVKALLTVTQRLRTHATQPDARPHLLISLLLQTGMKKAECMALKPSDFVRLGFNAPAVWIRYDKPRLRYKERMIAIEADVLTVLDEYLAQRTPEEAVFDCTPRNLEYVLRDAADLAGVPRSHMNFEALRWTCALHDYRAGMEPDALRIKLGVSHITWRETRRKLAELDEKRL